MGANDVYLNTEGDLHSAMQNNYVPTSYAVSNNGNGGAPSPKSTFSRVPLADVDSYVHKVLEVGKKPRISRRRELAPVA